MKGPYGRFRLMTATFEPRAWQLAVERALRVLGLEAGERDVVVVGRGRRLLRALEVVPTVEVRTDRRRVERRAVVELDVAAQRERPTATAVATSPTWSRASARACVVPGWSPTSVSVIWYTTRNDSPSEISAASSTTGSAAAPKTIVVDDWLALSAPPEATAATRSASTETATPALRTFRIPSLPFCCP